MQELGRDILQQVAYLPRALLLLPVFCLAYLYISEHGRNTFQRLKGLLKQPWLVLFLLDLLTILVSTVLSRQIHEPYGDLWKHFGFRADEAWNNEIIENILLFIPYGFLFLKAFDPIQPAKACAVVSLATTLLIELLQLLLWLGKFQLSDLFHNFLGGMIGYGIWQGLR